MPVRDPRWHVMTRTVPIPVDEVFQTFCIGCCEVVQVRFHMWTDQEVALRWAIKHRVTIICLSCNARVKLDIPRAA